MLGNISTSYVTIRFPKKTLSNELSYIHQYFIEIVVMIKVPITK